MFDPTGQPWENDPRATGGEERVVWDNGDIRLTNRAVLLAADSERPERIPLDTIHEVKVEYGCLVLCAAEGEVWSSVFDNPEELAALVRDEAERVRRAHASGGS